MSYPSYQDGPNQGRAYPRPPSPQPYAQPVQQPDAYAQAGPQAHAQPAQQPFAQPAPQSFAQPYAQPASFAQPGAQSAPQAYAQPGPQAYAQPAAQWPQQPAQPYAPPRGGPYAAQAVDPNALQCRFCGCVPAARVTFRGHRGMIVMMTFLSLAGPFCRDCGLSTFRRMTASTLIAGWWGYASFLITPVTVVINLVRRGKVADLPAPVPAPNGPSQHPMDPGKPLLARPQAIIGLALPGTVFVLFLILLIIGAVTSGSS